MMMNPEDAKVYGMSGVDVQDLFQNMVDDQKKRRKKEGEKKKNDKLKQRKN